VSRVGGLTQVLSPLLYGSCLRQLVRMQEADTAPQLYLLLFGARWISGDGVSAARKVPPGGAGCWSLSGGSGCASGRIGAKYPPARPEAAGRLRPPPSSPAAYADGQAGRPCVASPPSLCSSLDSDMTRTRESRRGAVLEYLLADVAVGPA
jgi:hypothetical protein